MARNRTRAARRNAQRRKRNAEAVEAAAEIVERRPKRRYSTTRTQLEILASRGNIGETHRKAGERLARDYQSSNTFSARLVGRYEANMPRAPRKYQAPADTIGSIAARERFDAALTSVGPWLSGILLHVCVCDLPVAEWGPLNGRAKNHGTPVLYTALEALCAHYGARGLPMAA